MGAKAATSTAPAALLPVEVNTERDRDLLEQFGVDVDHLLDGLGEGGLGKMIGC